LADPSAAMTLDIYAHLFPADEDRTRTVTDDALAEFSSGKGALCIYDVDELDPVSQALTQGDIATAVEMAWAQTEPKPRCSSIRIAPGMDTDRVNRHVVGGELHWAD
jgi:acetyl-CoA acetyltransferase